MISRFERFSFVISEISRHWHHIAADEMVKYGLKGHHALYLITMKRYPDGITATQLADICSRDKSDVSRAMSLMEEKGLAQKGTEGAKYRALLKLTKAGNEAASQVEQSAMKAVEMASRGVSDANRETFYATMDIISANLQKIIDDGVFANNSAADVHNEGANTDE